MFGLIKRNGKSVLGVDISSSSVKVLELGRDGSGKYSVEAYGKELLPAGTIVENSIRDKATVGEAVKSAVRRSGSKLKKAAAAVSGSAVITKTIVMDASLSDEEMETQIVVEADQHVPFATDEVAIDFELIGLKENDPDKVEVLLAACRQEHVDALDECLELAGLEARIIDNEAYATERVVGMMGEDLSPTARGGAVALFDIGAASLSMSVLEDGMLRYSRDQLFGGRQLTAEIQRHYSVDEAEAERLKLSRELHADFEKELLVPFREAVVQQVFRSLQLYQSSEPDSNVDTILLAGGTASVRHLGTFVQKKLGIRTHVVNPFRDMKLSRRVDAELLTQNAPSLLVSCGLAMRSFD